MDENNLTSMPWLAVNGPRGPEVVGLRELFHRADELDLAVPDPLQWAAVFRQVILPIALDALGPPADDVEWARRWDAGRFDTPRVDAYLDRHADRFDLFDPEAPFGQVANLVALSGETKPSSALIATAPGGNNVPLFAARTDATPPELSPAAAALAMLACQCWDTAAIKTGAEGDPNAKAGKTTGNPTGPLGQLGLVIPTGLNLFQTVLLNTRIIAAGSEVLGVPWWRRDPPTAAWSPRSASGLLDLLTWQSRCIRLFPEQNTDGRTVIRRVVVAAGDRLVTADKDTEPHTVWKTVEKPKAGDPSHRPVRHQSGRALWRGLPGLLAIREGDRSSAFEAPIAIQQISRLRNSDVLSITFPLKVRSVGVEYGNQSAVVENVIADEIPLPVAALTSDPTSRDLLVQIVDQADQTRAVINRLADDVRRAGGGDPVPWDKSQRPGDQLLYQLDQLVRRVLAGFQREPDHAYDGADAWATAARGMALAAAESVLSAAAPETFLGRGDGKSAVRLATAESRARWQLNQIYGVPERADQT